MRELRQPYVDPGSLIGLIIQGLRSSIISNGARQHAEEQR